MTGADFNGSAKHLADHLLPVTEDFLKLASHGDRMRARPADYGAGLPSRETNAGAFDVSSSASATLPRSRTSSAPEGTPRCQPVSALPIAFQELAYIS